MLRIPKTYIIIGLACCFSIGLLLNILSCALYHNWWPFFVVVTYMLAPLPNMICGRCVDGDDMFASPADRNYADTGYFLTGAFVISGFGVPAILAHSNIMQIPALVLAIMGGLIVYGTILMYLHFFFRTSEEEYTF